VCSLITGPVDAVEQAIGRARERLAGDEWFMASAVIPQPLPSVLSAFVLFRPTAGTS
jgi:microcompartment protein CcmL/EutN